MNEEVLRSMINEPSISAVVLKETSSTNDLLKSLANEGAPEGTLVLAEEQTAGRGRMGRSFYSPQGTGLYMSLLLRPEIYMKEALIITAMAAVAGAEAIDELRRRKAPKCRIKWVNDLILDGRKICGILAEAAFSSSSKPDFIVIGIGFNVNTPVSAFPEELRNTAGSLFSCTSKTVDRELLIGEMIRELDRMASDHMKEKNVYLSFYRSRSVTVGKNITVIRGDEKKPAFAESVSDSFALRVRFADGSREDLSTGEITIR